jgi:hypothetical protein
MATTTTNFGWDIPESTDLVKDGATAIAALGQDIDTALVDLEGGTTGQVLAKASGTDLDFSWVANGGTKIGQVVTSTTSSSTAATGGAGYTDVSGLSVTITPTLTSSKILIITSFVILGSGTTYQSGQVQLLRTSTSLTSTTLGSYYPGGASTNFADYMQYSQQYVDSPSTTSATTYKMQINNVFSTTNWQANPSASSIQISALEILV